MAAEISFFKADGVTPLPTMDLGRILPGENFITKWGAPYRVVMKNTGDTAFATVEVHIEQVGTYDAYLKIELATGLTAPAYPTGYFNQATDPLIIGGLAVGAIANLWVQLTEPATALPQSNKAFVFRLIVT